MSNDHGRMHKKLRKILITGGAGFIGSEFVRQGLSKGYSLVVADNLTYAGDLSRLKEALGAFTFYKIDICQFSKVASLFKKEKPDGVIHFAAETHVDRSIQNAQPFILTNIVGTQNLIDLSRKYSVRKFLHISTDEVYGDSQNGLFKENFPLKPNNPYSATKTAAELLVKAAIRTYDFPAVIIRPSNNYGPWQYTEKFIPVIIFKALKNERIPVYGKGRQIREWLYVRDCVEAIDLLLAKGRVGEIYNIGSYFEKDNLTTAKIILRYLNKSQSLIQFVEDRPGHDFRYSVDSQKLNELGWKPRTKFDEGIKETIQWYKDHSKWLQSKYKYLHRYWKNIYQSK